MDSPQSLKKRLKSIGNINKILTIDNGFCFAIMKVIKHTAFLRASERRQFFCRNSFVA